MVYMYLVPLFAVIFAAVTIGEKINIMQLVGGFICCKKRGIKKTAFNFKK